MGMMMADVTEIPGASVDDLVTLLGQQDNEAIYADELASMVETIPYELLCRLGRHPNPIWLP